MNFASHGVAPRIIPNFALRMTILCVFLHLSTATTLDTRSDNKNTGLSAASSQDASVPDPTALHPNSGIPITNQIDNPSPSSHGLLSLSTFGPEGFLENSQLLIDPSYPISHTPSPNEVQVSNPVHIVTSALLTAATPLPKAPNKSFVNSANSSHYNHTRNLPVLSGSMTISLPTIPPVPAPSAAPKGSMPNGPLPLNTGTHFKSPHNMSSTPTTSTAYVYAINPPQNPSAAANSQSSASGRNFSTSPNGAFGLVSLVLLTVLDHL